MRWEYAKSWKMLAVVLNQICAVVLVLSVAVCTFFAGSRGFSWVGSDESFESTAYYQSEVLEQIYRCIRAASRESKFEKDGVYDSDLLVDVEEYAQSSTILEGDPADGRLYYRLTDLLNWSLDGFETVTLMKLTYDDGSVGYLWFGSRLDFLCGRLGGVFGGKLRGRASGGNRGAGSGGCGRGRRGHGAGRDIFRRRRIWGFRAGFRSRPGSRRFRTGFESRADGRGGRALGGYH